VSRFLRDPCTKNYCNFYPLIPKIKMWLFGGHSVMACMSRYTSKSSLNMRWLLACMYQQADRRGIWAQTSAAWQPHNQRTLSFSRKAHWATKAGCRDYNVESEIRTKTKDQPKVEEEEEEAIYSPQNAAGIVFFRVLRPNFGLSDPWVYKDNLNWPVMKEHL